MMKCLSQGTSFPIGTRLTHFGQISAERQGWGCWT
jgi:hypothetical protein